MEIELFSEKYVKLEIRLFSFFKRKTIVPIFFCLNNSSICLQFSPDDRQCPAIYFFMLVSLSCLSSVVL